MNITKRFTIQTNKQASYDVLFALEDKGMMRLFRPGNGCHRRLYRIGR